jgi:hypothetical protein
MALVTRFAGAEIFGDPKVNNCPERFGITQRFNVTHYAVNQHPVTFMALQRAPQMLRYETRHN